MGKGTSKRLQPSLKQRKRRERRRAASGQRTRPAVAPRRLASCEQGLQLLGQGNLSGAQQEFEQRLRENPEDAVTHNCMGIVLRALKLPDRALACFRRALDYRPGFAEAHNNMGNALLDLDRLDEALQAYRRALSCRPEFPPAHNNLGVVLLKKSQPDQAVDCFQTARALQPNYIEAHNNLGNAYRELGRFAEAEASCLRALQLAPESAEVHSNLANVYRDQDQLLAARAHSDEALRLDPDCFDAWNNRGVIQLEMDHLEEALHSYERAAEIDPTAAEPHIQLGSLFKLQGRVAESQTAYERAARLAPADPLHPLRIASLCPTVFRSRDEAQQYPQQARDTWRRLASAPLDCSLGQKTAQLAEPSFNLQFLAGNIRPLKEAYAAIYRDRFQPPSPPPSPRAVPQIGLLVTRGHEGIFLRSMHGILERISPDLGQIIVVCPRRSVQRIREGIRRDVALLSLPDRFTPAVEAIREANFDVLYYWEIGTDGTNYFLPFLGLARVQCTGWGMQATSGNPHVDYYLSNSLVEPQEAADHYSEQLLLGHTFLVHQDPPRLGQPLDREDFGFCTSEHLYVCAQHIGKIHPDFDQRLAGILRRDPAARVVLTDDPYGNGARMLPGRFAESMPDVSSRVTILPRQTHRSYLSLLAMADVLLDPPHFSGANSSYDGFSLGKPIVTLPAQCRRGRFTWACYQKMGIQDCIAHTEDAYVDLAVSLGTEPDHRQEVQAKIRQSRSVLFQEQAAVEEFERLLRQLVEQARGQ